MAIYRLRSFTESRRLIAVQRFSAADDYEAVSMAAAMVEGSAVTSFDLWEGERRVEGAAPMRKEKPRH